VPEFRQAGAYRRHLALVQQVGRHQHPRGAELQARAYGFGTEGREQRAEHQPGAQRAERHGVQRRAAAEQREHALAALHAQLRQRIGAAIRGAEQRSVTVVLARALAAEEAHGESPAQAALHLPVERFDADVDRVRRRAGQPRALAAPVEVAPLTLVIRHVRRERRPVGPLLADRRIHRSCRGPSWIQTRQVRVVLDLLVQTLPISMDDPFAGGEP
jgi:hypothetical protein